MEIIDALATELEKLANCHMPEAGAKWGCGRCIAIVAGRNWLARRAAILDESGRTTTNA